MAQSNKLSLSSAIFINLNIMVSTGIFVNTVILSQKAGAAGFLLYPIIGILMLPLIAAVGKLLSWYPSGGFYAFAKDVSPFLGFLSCWSYFFGKLASGTLMLYVSTIFLQQLIPPLYGINPLHISMVILALFAFLNLFNMKVGVTIQSFFLTAKFIPIFFAITIGILMFDTSNITSASFIWEGVPTSIPFVLYCLAGFEAACSLSRNIENPSINAPKAIYYSFGIIMILYAIFQGFLYMMTHSVIDSLQSYQYTFPYIASKFFSSPQVAHKASLLLSFAIGSSALGGSYGVLFSNPWNLYTLAEHNHTFFSKQILKLNHHAIPTIAVLVETIVCAFFLFFTQGNQIPLQQTASLGVTLAYTVSAFSYFYIGKQRKFSLSKQMISIFALGTCALFIASSINGFLQTGIAPMLLFFGILLFGTSMFILKKIQKG